MRANVKGPWAVAADLVANLPMRLRRLGCRVFGHTQLAHTFYIVDGVKRLYCWRCGGPYAP